MPVLLDNPIVNALQAALQMRRQNENTKFQQERQKEEGSRAQEQLTGYLAHLKAEEAHQSASLDLEKSKVGMERAAHQLQAQRTIADMISSGQYDPNGNTGQEQSQPQQPQASMPGNFTPISGPTQGPAIPQAQQIQQPQGGSSPVNPIILGDPNNGGMTIDPRNFTSYQQMQQRKLTAARAEGQIQAETAGATASATGKAKEPFEIAEEQRKALVAEKVAKQEQEYKMLQIGAEGVNRLNDTKERNKGGIAEANIHAKASVDAARLRTFAGINDAEDLQKATAPFLYGEASKALSNTPRDSIIRQHLGDGIPGAVEIQPKAGASIRDDAQIESIYKEMQGIIDRLPSSKLNAAGQHIIAKLPATDQQNLDDQVNGLSLQLSKMQGTFAARAIKTEIPMIRALLGGGTGKTKEQATENLNLGRRLNTTNILDRTLASAPEAQKLDVLLHYHIDPSGMTTKGSDGKTYPRYAQQEGQWFVFNPKTLHNDPIGK